MTASKPSEPSNPPADSQPQSSDLLPEEQQLFLEYQEFIATTGKALYSQLGPPLEKRLASMEKTYSSFNDTVEQLKAKLAEHESSLQTVGEKQNSIGRAVARFDKRFASLSSDLEDRLAPLERRIFTLLIISVSGLAVGLLVLLGLLLKGT